MLISLIAAFETAALLALEIMIPLFLARVLVLPGFRGRKHILGIASGVAFLHTENILAPCYFFSPLPVV